MPSQHSDSINLDRDAFTALARFCAREHGADLLLSGPGFPGETQSTIALFPRAELVVGPTTTPEEIARFCFTSRGQDSPVLGWLSYELGMRLRGVPVTKHSGLPQGHLRKYAGLVEHDAGSGACRITTRDAATEHLLHGLVGMAREGKHDLPARPLLGPARATMNRSQYENGVARTLEYIRDGEAYQLNLSIKFERPARGLDPLNLFLHLFRHHPAPFYAWFHGKDYRLLSTSPERFLKVEDGTVLSQPIKGTRLVGDNADAARSALLDSDKERAELSMIVDLIRNDISHHCDYGSVQVKNHCSIFQVDDLLQMHSSVTGRLRAESTCLDLLLDALPGGSITGCPKRRAMELIDSLEPHARGAYCGCFVRIDNERTMDSSILIRTAMHDLKDETLSFHAGSGIVVDSSPSLEYEETMAKAAKLLQEGGT